MSYVFERKRSSSFKFQAIPGSNLTLKGISPTEDAVTICNALDSLMAIGSVTSPVYYDGVRTVNDIVIDDDQQY